MDDSGCANSFSADTTVATPDGDVPISEIEVGDEVLAYNEATRSVGEYAVTATISHLDLNKVLVTVEGETLHTTAEHPFYTYGGEWVNAADLEVGDQVWSLENGYGEVEAVEQVETVEPMFNLTVENAHTFFVGEADWLVHNVACQEFDIVPYKTKAPGFEKHHGVMDVWARANYPRSQYNRRNAPSIVLAKARHDLTVEWFRNWRLQRTGNIAGKIDWTTVDVRTANEITMEMFRAANTRCLY